MKIASCYLLGRKNLQIFISLQCAIRTVRFGSLLRTGWEEALDTAVQNVHFTATAMSKRFDPQQNRKHSKANGKLSLAPSFHRNAIMRGGAGQRGPAGDILMSGVAVVGGQRCAVPRLRSQY